MSDLRAHFSAELRTARRSAGMTQEELAAATATSADYLSKLERGLNSPSLETLAVLVKTLSMDPARILLADEGDRDVGVRRLELEAKISNAMGQLDDSSLGAMLEMAETLKKLAAQKTR